MARRKEIRTARNALVMVILALFLGACSSAQTGAAEVAEETDVAISDAPFEEQPYRWEFRVSEFPGEGLVRSGVIDPTGPWYQIREDLRGESLELIFDEEIAGMRYEGSGQIIAVSEAEAAAVSGDWYVVDTGEQVADAIDPHPASVVTVLTLDSFEIDAQEELGEVDIDGVSTQHLRVTGTATPDAEETLISYSPFALIEPGSEFEVWVREEGRIARIVTFLDEDGEQAEFSQLDLFDFGVPVDATWPDGAPPTEVFPIR